MITPVSAAAKIKKKKYINAFKTAGAVSENTARSLKDLKLFETLIFTNMVKRGIFVRTGEGKYWLNLTVLEVFQNHRNYYAKIAIIIAVLIILAIILGLLTN